MLAEHARFPIVEETRLETASRNVTTGAPFSRQRPRTVEIAHVLIAIVKQALVQRRHHFQRVAKRDDELGARPQLQDRLELLGRVKVADRAFGEDRRTVAVAEIEIELPVANDLLEVRGLLAAKVMHQEVMRFLRRRETYVGVLAEVFRHCSRTAARRSDDEHPA
jgi:hypothetical protein